MTKSLSSREQKVLELIAQGYEYKGTAHWMFISVATVKRHVSSAINKLNALNSTHAVALALKKGLIRFPD